MRKLQLVVGGLAVLVAFLLVAVMACDGGGGEGEVEDQLRQIVLQAEDVPTGFSLTDEVFSTNEESASAGENPQERLAELQRWGRILGYEVTYESDQPAVGGQTLLFLVHSAASMYESSEGASASFTDAVETARTTDWAAHFSVEPQYLETEELSISGLADEAMWLRVKTEAQPGEQGFAFDMVILRQGPSRGSLQTGSFGTEESKQIVEELARTQAQHMASVVR